LKIKHNFACNALRTLLPFALKALALLTPFYAKAEIVGVQILPPMLTRVPALGPEPQTEVTLSECGFQKLFDNPTYIEMSLERAERELDTGRIAAFFPMGKSFLRDQKWLSSESYAKQNVFLVYDSKINEAPLSENFLRKLQAGGRKASHSMSLAKEKRIPFSVEVLNFSQLSKMLLVGRINSFVVPEHFLKDAGTSEMLASGSLKSFLLGTIDYVAYFSKEYRGLEFAKARAEDFGKYILACGQK
jgi:hypothetical protein